MCYNSLELNNFHKLLQTANIVPMYNVYIGKK